MCKPIHIPVLKKEVIEYLNPKPGQNFVDCTIGQCGHAKAILEKNKPDGKVLGIELDSELYEEIKKEERANKKRLILVNDSYVNLEEIVKEYNFKKVNGILFDLGLCSWHFEKSKKGFSFQKKEILDMRYSTKHQLTAEKIINYWSSFDIEMILKEYGDEKFARKITKEIIERRGEKEISETTDLVDVIRRALPKEAFQHRMYRHFATRTFQALRIRVNNELENLKQALPQALNVLKPKGTLVVISFHSLEDAIVKNFFKDKSQENLIEILTKKPIVPNKYEIKNNHSSRSAKMRVIKKL